MHHITHWKIIVLLAWLLLMNSLRAELLLLPEQAVVSAGEQIDMQIYAHDDADISTAADFPAQLELRLRNDAGEAGKAVAELLQRHPQAPVASASYRVRVATSAVQGMLQMYIIDAAGSSRSKPAFVLIDAEADAPTQAVASNTNADKPGQGADADAETALVQIASDAENIDEEATRNPFRDNIMAYDPVYFIAGASPSNAKFQLSFKYRFLHPDTAIADRHPWLTGFYMAYSQTSFWDLSTESIPFTDTNFKPELFYQFNDVRFNFLPDSAYVDLRTGIKHESNGEDEERSRSLNMAYIEPAMHFRLTDEYRLSLTPRIWAYVGSKKENPDIRRFRGNNSIAATISKRDSWQLQTMLRGNIGTGRGAIQMDLSYPANQLIPGLDLYLYSQFFTGFGENLLNYNVKDTRLRFGIGILR